MYFSVSITQIVSLPMKVSWQKKYLGIFLKLILSDCLVTSNDGHLNKNTNGLWKMSG